MKKIVLSLFVISIIAISCKKNSTNCYACHVTANGNDTVICNKTQKQIDDMIPNTLSSCIETD